MVGEDVSIADVLDPGTASQGGEDSSSKDNMPAMQAGLKVAAQPGLCTTHLCWPLRVQC